MNALTRSRQRPRSVVALDAVFPEAAYFQLLEDVRRSLGDVSFEQPPAYDRIIVYGVDQRVFERVVQRHRDDFENPRPGWDAGLEERLAEAEDRSSELAAELSGVRAEYGTLREELRDVRARERSLAGALRAVDQAHEELREEHERVVAQRDDLRSRVVALSMPAAYGGDEDVLTYLNEEVALVIGDARADVLFAEPAYSIRETARWLRRHAPTIERWLSKGRLRRWGEGVDVVSIAYELLRSAERYA